MRNRRRIFLLVIFMFSLLNVACTKEDVAIIPKKESMDLMSSVKNHCELYISESVNWDAIYDNYWDESTQIWSIDKDAYVEEQKRLAFESSINYTDYLIGKEKPSRHDEKYRIVPISLKYTENGTEKVNTEDTVWIKTDKGWMISYKQTIKSQLLSTDEPADGKLDIVPLEAIYSENGVHLRVNISNASPETFLLGWVGGYNLNVITDSQTYSQHFNSGSIASGATAERVIFIENAMGDIMEMNIDNIFLSRNGLPGDKLPIYTFFKR